MKPTTGSGSSQITKQGQTKSSKHASDPYAKGKVGPEATDLSLKTKSE